LRRRGCRVDVGCARRRMGADCAAGVSFGGRRGLLGGQRDCFQCQRRFFARAGRSRQSGRERRRYSKGDRILARNGAGQVGLGQRCFAFIAANSISIVAEQDDGVTCLRPSTATGVPGGTATGPEFNPVLVGVGLAGLAVVGAAIAIGGSHPSPSLSP
jgi:hypothetical protein